MLGLEVVPRRDEGLRHLFQLVVAICQLGGEVHGLLLASGHRHQHGGADVGAGRPRGVLCRNLDAALQELHLLLRALGLLAGHGGGLLGFPGAVLQGLDLGAEGAADRMELGRGLLPGDAALQLADVRLARGLSRLQAVLAYGEALDGAVRELQLSVPRGAVLPRLLHLGAEVGHHALLALVQLQQVLQQ